MWRDKCGNREIPSFEGPNCKSGGTEGTLARKLEEKARRLMGEKNSS